MGLLDKLKSLFGSDQNGQSPAGGTQADVTVEHEPAAESEHAVKGTDAAGQRSEDRSQDHSSTDPESTADAGEAADSTAAAETAPEAVGEEPEAETDTPDDEADVTTDGADTTADSPSVEEIKGIGPTYAERLEAAGISTVADLAAADPAEVAEAAQTGENRAGDWVERAQDF